MKHKYICGCGEASIECEDYRGNWILSSVVNCKNCNSNMFDLVRAVEVLAPRKLTMKERITGYIE